MLNLVSSVIHAYLSLLHPPAYLQVSYNRLHARHHSLLPLLKLPLLILYAQFHPNLIILNITSV